MEFLLFGVIFTFISILLLIYANYMLSSEDERELKRKKWYLKLPFKILDKLFEILDKKFDKKRKIKKCIYELPIEIGDNVWITSAFGEPYLPEEIDKCGGYKVSQINIREDKILIKIEKKNNDMFIDIDSIGKTVFLNKEDTLNKLKYYLENGIEELT